MSIRFENRELLARVQEQVQIANSARIAAEQANKAKSHFLAAASHDLRQPLHSLMLFTGLLDQGQPEKRAEFLTHIRSAADSLNTLFSSLLDLSKLDAGAVPVSVLNVNVSEVARQILGEFQLDAERRGISLRGELIDVSINTDPFLLERILRNLLDNAIKYTQNGERRCVTF